MILFVVNYKNEIDLSIFEKFDYVDIKVMNETKGSIFALKLIKFLAENKGKYDLVLHYGLCGGKSASMIGTIFKIDRTFLFYKDYVIENQRFRLGSYCFDTVGNSNIVTKFSFGKHSNKLYDFADIYDLETFWIAQVTTQFSLPIITIKGVSDNNDMFCKSDEEEIESLITFDLNNIKRHNLKKFKQSIAKLNIRFEQFFIDEILVFYNKLVQDQNFKKKLLH